MWFTEALWFTGVPSAHPNWHGFPAPQHGRKGQVGMKTFIKKYTFEQMYICLQFKVCLTFTLTR